MINRNKYDDMIMTMKEIVKNHENCNFNLSIEKIEKTKKNFNIKLMVVGHFNAGKSSLLNALIKRPGFLKEAQEPQTAIATELIFDEIEKKFAYTFDDIKENITSEDGITPDKYNHLEYRINSKALKEIDDFTIVDTPGFDAGVEAHAKALANYIGLGSAYLVIIDQEKGGIDGVTLDFIEEISNYSNQIAILINKCDKITEDIAEDIAESARLTLETYGFPYKVYTVSKRDTDISKKLTSIISEFNSQKIFDDMLKKNIISELINMEKILTVTNSKLYLDTFDLDTEISAYEVTKEQLEFSFNKKREEAKNNLESTVESVALNIKSTLIARSDLISEAILNGNKSGAEAIIVEIIRPIMLSSMKDISCQQIDNMVKTLDFSGLVSEKDKEALTDVAINLANNIKDLIEQGAFESKNIKDESQKEKKLTAYRAIAGIAAITTDFIAPWAEVIIILLPDIIKLLDGMFGESNLEVAKRRFINTIVPQIMNKVYPQIKQNMEITTKQVIDEYEKLLTEKLEIIKNNIISNKEKRKERVDEYEKYKDTISKDIDTVYKLLQK